MTFFFFFLMIISVNNLFITFSKVFPLNYALNQFILHSANLFEGLAAQLASRESLGEALQFRGWGVKSPPMGVRRQHP